MGALPTPFEVATGIPLGQRDDPEPLPQVPPTVTALQALEDAIRPALLRPPCAVTFSGGRDSSPVLAVATALARREGLPLPVPVTMRFPGVESAEESHWQELVVEHVKPKEWVKLVFTDELDFVGPVATAALRRHGILWPPNAYCQKPMLDQVPGGSLLTGLDGDGVFGAWRYLGLSQLVHLENRPRRRHLRLLAAAAAPGPVRGRVLRRQLLAPVEAFGWLTPAVRMEHVDQFVADHASEPARWRQRLQWQANRRYLHLLVCALDALGTDSDTEIHHPLMAPLFLSTVARLGGWRGPGSRTRAMRLLFSELLPGPVLERASKAEFTHAFWRAHTKSFVERWDGTGVDPGLVDVEALREIWTRTFPLSPTLLLLQQAWLATTRS